MTVGSVSQEVSVTAEAPLVETTSGTLGGLVNEERVADLPLNGRNFTDLTLMQTGISVQYGPSQYKPPIVTTGILFSSNGAGIRSNFQSLDGANLVTGQGYNGASAVGTQLGVDGIREFIVVTNGLKAEYGMVMGSQTMIVTKSGTNQFHGTAFDYLRNSALDARNFFNPVPLIPAFRRNNFGGAFGGPIKKDKTFFFVTYEGIRQSTGHYNSLHRTYGRRTFGQSSDWRRGDNFYRSPGQQRRIALSRSLSGRHILSKATAADVFPYCTGGVGRYPTHSRRPSRRLWAGQD